MSAPWEHSDQDDELAERVKRSEQRYQQRQTKGKTITCVSCGVKLTAWRNAQVRCLDCLNLVRRANGLEPVVHPERPCSVCGKTFIARGHQWTRCQECKEAKRLPTKEAPSHPPCPVCSDRGWLPTGLVHEEWGWLVTPCPACSPLERKPEVTT